MGETRINIKGLVFDLKTNYGTSKFKEMKTRRFILHFNKPFKRRI